jgi:hypothetical protein
MRTFTTTAGILFALIFLAHVLRIVVEGMTLLYEPIFLLTSIASLTVAVWAFLLLRRR